MKPMTPRKPLVRRSRSDSIDRKKSCGRRSSWSNKRIQPNFKR